MDLVYAIVGGLVTLALLALAAGSLIWGAKKNVSRWLAALLVGIAGLFASSTTMLLTTDRWLAYNAFVWNTAIYPACIATYLIFVGQALDTPVVALLRTRFARFGLAALAVVAGAAGVVGHAGLFAGILAQPDGTWYAPYQSWAIIPFLVLNAAPFLFGLVASVHAWRRAAKGTAARSRAGAYVLAFGIQDVNLIITNSLSALTLSASGLRAIIAVSSIVELVALSLIVRALLKWHLFDFDLKVKLGVKRGTVAAIMLGAVLVVGQLAQSYLNSAFGLVAGAIAAALVLLALKPIERVAERVSDAAMPRVNATPEYLAFKKLDVYRAAIESALENGGAIDARERDILDRLRAKLGLGAPDASALEDETRARLAV